MFDGRVPAEVHKYRYGKNGRVTSVTVIREPEWLEDDQLKAEALTLIEANTCKCGNYLPESSQPDFVSLVDHTTCYACRSLEIIRRDEDRAHEKDPKPAPGRPGWNDGRIPIVRPAEASEIVGRFRPE